MRTPITVLCYSRCTYYWLSDACGFRYEAIFGMAKGEGDFESVFQVDATTLDVKIREMLE